MPFRSTAQRFSLLNISLRNNTFCFWDQLVGGWPLFSPPGAPIRHAGPGPEPKPGREPEPRRWHTDRQSDPLAGPGFRPGHRLLVQDTRQIERHTGGEERRVKVRHDSVARAAFLVLAFDEGKEKQASGGRWGRTHFGSDIECLIHQMFWYVKYISSPCCLVCSLLLKQVGNKGKLLVRSFFFFSFFFPLF